VTISYPDADRHTHCGFRFEGGAKCMAASVHPIHTGAWQYVRGQEVDHAYQPETHKWTEPRCSECGQPKTGKVAS
jgi:hypothetical protein